MQTVVTIMVATVLLFCANIFVVLCVKLCCFVRRLLVKIFIRMINYVKVSIQKFWQVDFVY